MDDVDPTWPVVEDPSNYTYIRPEGGGLLVGLFEGEAAPWAVDRAPEDFAFGEIDPDWDRVGPYLELATSRVRGPASFRPSRKERFPRARVPVSLGKSLPAASPSLSERDSRGVPERDSRGVPSLSERRTPAGARVGGRGREDALLRARVLRARPRASRRRSAGAPELLRGGGAEFHRHLDGPGRGSDGGELDRRRRAGRRRDGRQRRPDEGLPAGARVPRGAGRGGAGRGLQVPLPVQDSSIRPAGAAHAAPRRVGEGGRSISRRVGLGGAGLVRF